MKKTILTILLLAFCVSISGAGITDKLRAVIAAKNAGGAAACDTVTPFQVSPDQAYGGQGFGQYTNTMVRGTQFTANSTTTICAATVELLEQGTITDGTLSIVIFNDNGSDDITETAIGSESATIDPTNLTSSMAQYQFTGLNAPVTLNNKYWLIIIFTGTPSTENYLGWQYVSYEGGTSKSGAATLLTLDQGAETRIQWFELYD